METNELKFLLKLLGCADYRSTLSANIFSSFKGKDKICRDLGDRELVDYSREIAAVKILPPGKALLQEPTKVATRMTLKHIFHTLGLLSGYF